ncbi:MAG: LD-carboxypeptidase [Candidatus Thorarchaeota archaeon]|nr:MAG: LD-carboxypeptidase [Candidatus Thorarchaeota archaeon]
MNLIKPGRLYEGDTVGVFSPAWPVDKRGQFDRGIEKLKSLGLNVRLGEHTLAQHYYSAGTRDERLEDFHSLWADPEVRMLLMSQGGSTTNQLLDGIDYDLLRSDPKILAGISDGTTLLNAVHARTGLVTYHGPDVIWTFGQKMTPQIERNIVSTFFERKPIELRPNENWQHQLKPDLKYPGWRCLREGRGTGRLVGGHIRILANTILAGYGPDFEGTILFLEGTDDVARTHSFITALRLHGVFDSVAGVILGWFEGSELEEKELSRPVSEAFLEETEDYDFPVLEIGELGHYVENYVLPIGCRATMDATMKRISLDEAPVT